MKCSDCPLRSDPRDCPARLPLYSAYCQLVSARVTQKEGGGDWSPVALAAQAANRPGYRRSLLQRADDPEIRAQLAALPPESVRPSAPPDLILSASLVSANGYGKVAEWLGRGLVAHGIEVMYRPIGRDESRGALPKFVADRILAGAEPLSPSGSPLPVLQLAWPHHPVATDRPVIVFTMWESTRISNRAVEELNRACAVIVPCAWNAENFRRCGVTVPIYVVPLGVSRAEGFYPDPGKVTRREEGGGTRGGTFHVGLAARTKHGGERKGGAEAVQAFLRAAGDDDSWRLRILTQSDCVEDFHLPPKPDSRIWIDTEPKTTEQVGDWYRSLDVVITGSKSEGFGLVGLESLACGVPVVGARYSGTAEYFDESVGWVAKHEEVAATRFYEGLGEWGVPRIESLAAGLRAAFDDPAEARRRELAGVERAGQFSWARMGRGVVDVLERVGTFDARISSHTKPYRPIRSHTSAYLGCFILTNTLLHLDRSVASIRDHVDRLLVGIDDRAGPEVDAWLGDRAIEHVRIPFDDSFSGAYNQLIARLDCPWIFRLDSDERIRPDSALRLRELAMDADAVGAIAVTVARRHWLDMEEIREKSEWWPDPSTRLLRRDTRYTGRTHEWVAGGPIATRLDVVIEHFNQVLYSLPEREANARESRRLAALGPEKPDGMIPSPQVDGIPTVASSSPGEIPRVIPALPARVPLADNLALSRRIRSCPHRTMRKDFDVKGIRDGGCGCNHCALGRGREGRVTDGDCRVCEYLPEIDEMGKIIPTAAGADRPPSGKPDKLTRLPDNLTRLPRRRRGVGGRRGWATGGRSGGTAVGDST